MDDVSLTINPGTITSIIGSSGSGKTTLVKIASLLELPNAGEIRIDNKHFDFSKKDTQVDNIWPKVTVVFQQLFIWPHLTVRQNIELPLRRALNKKEKVHFDELVSMFEMDSFLDRYPNEVSLGQKQRTALVRALMLKPKYLLLDEVTASLDPEQSSIILTHLEKIKQQGVGILIVAHNLDFAFAISDKVIFLDEGCIVKAGKPYEFLLEEKNKKILKFVESTYTGIPDIKYYSGFEEFQGFHLNLLKRLPDYSTIYVIGGMEDTWYSSMGDHVKEYISLREKKNINQKMLMYEDGKIDRNLVQRRPDLNEYYIFPQTVKNKANVNIMSDGSSLIQIWQVPQTLDTLSRIAHHEHIWVQTPNSNTVMLY
ncbi:MAG: ATP-binding cassette domain-containing protein, partial [Chlamydiota bacterium]|nr:ATP-binding cassette domain-containing protein [Chlamydiota bacterium]